VRRHGTADGEETSSRDPVHEVGVTGNCTMSQVLSNEYIWKELPTDSPSADIPLELAPLSVMPGHAQLPMAANSSSPSKYMRKHLKRISKAIMKSHRVQLPKYDLPIRLRPVCLSSLSHDR
jgi:hypothetical protein